MSDNQALQSRASLAHGAVVEVEAETRHWLATVVIGLNLCPFAKGVLVKNQIHFVISNATDTQALMVELERELLDLANIAPEVRDTTLLIVPFCLQDFLDFIDSLVLADRLLTNLRLDGNLQIASFHPDFQFAGTDADDVTNCTNRSPYPTLHLLRESSIDRAVQAFPQAEMIYEENMKTLQALGFEGWRALGLGKARGKAGP